MGRTKLKKFIHNRLTDNVLVEEKPYYKIVKGKWNELIFGNNNPIILELACGKGEFTVGLAKIYPEKNFIGIDLKGDRIAVGSRLANEQCLTNIAFLRADIVFLNDFFDKTEVYEIWVTFPDPFNMKNGRERRRLTHQLFLEKYKAVLISEGILHLKTDNQELFDFTLGQLPKAGFEVVAQTDDFYNSSMKNDHFQIKTKFEEVFSKRGFTIKYLKAKLLIG